MIPLSNEELALLEEVVSRWDPKLLEFVDLTSSELWSVEDRLALQLAAASELSAAGLDVDSEPNSRGLLLEALIDRLQIVG